MSIEDRDKSFKEYVNLKMEEYSKIDPYYRVFESELFDYLMEQANKGKLSIEMFKTFCEAYIKSGLDRDNHLDGNNIITYEKVFEKIWSKLEKKDPKLLKDFIKEMEKTPIYYTVKDENNNEYTEKSYNKDYDAIGLLDYTDPEDKECMFILFQSHFRNLSSEQIEKKIKRFKALYKIDQKKDVEYLADLFDGFELETIIRMRAINFLKLQDTEVNEEFIQNVVKQILDDTHKNEALSRIADAFYHYRYQIFEEFSPNYIDQSRFGQDGFEQDGFEQDGFGQDGFGQGGFGQGGFGRGSKTKLVVSQGAYLPEILDEKNQELFKKLVYIMLKDPDNIFKINTIEDVKNYEQIRKETCLKILKEEDCDFGYQINNMSIQEKRKFVLLELLYGIDYAQAKRLVDKYGKDIDEIEPQTQKEQEIKNYIHSIRHIVQLDDDTIQKLMQDEKFMSFIENAKIPDIASDIWAEKEIIGIFEREYDKKIESSDVPQKGTTLFNGKEIPTEICSPIDKDGNFRYTEMSFFIRQEGAYTDWEVPSSYRDYFMIQSAVDHVNCESFVNQSQLAFAKSKGGPRGGYLKSGSLIYMAPWDIVTNISNMSFSPISNRSNPGKGLEIRMPEKLIDYTRHKHNESNSDRIEKIDEDGMQKRIPDRSVYVQERFDENKDTLDSLSKSEWHESLRMAEELEIPLRIVDREGIAIQEEMVIQHDIELLGGPQLESFAGVKDIEKLTGKKCNIVDWSKKPKLSREELIREIIVRFENNVIGLQFSKIKDQYFTDEKREEMLQALIKTIEMGKDTNPEQYKKDLETIERVIAEEKSKETTNKGIKVYTIPPVYLELEQKIDIMLDKDNLRDSICNINNKDEFDKVLDFIYDSKLYDENEVHSTDHIAKTTLFANILAHRENLSNRDTTLLLISSALHDCGREGEDGNKPHAKVSSEKAGVILRGNDSPFKSFNLSEDEIKIIQIAIEYHERDEKNFGELGHVVIEDNIQSHKDLISRGLIEDVSITGLMKKHNLDEKHLQKVIKMCALLKDADALDRERFSGDKSPLIAQYLHTKSAKDIRVISFANRLNNQIANKILEKYYGQKEPSRSAVILLEDKKQETLPDEIQKLTKEEMVESFKTMGMSKSGKRKIDLLREQYEKQCIRIKDVETAKNLIVSDARKFERGKEEPENSSVYEGLE